MMAIEIEFEMREKIVAGWKNHMATFFDQFGVKKHKGAFRHVKPKWTGHGTTPNILGRYQHN
jgi:hypothetical protein